MKSSCKRLLFLVLCLAFTTFVDGKRRKKEDEAEQLEDLNSHFLIKLIGHEMYAVVQKPKYKFLIYMTVGTLPSEEHVISMITTVCNLLYGVAIWLGFIWISRERMLFITLLTLYVGPAIILVLLGATGAALAAFAIYPTISVLSMFMWFFLTSQLAQVLGRKLGLDSDNDGDVDLLDFLHYAAQTKFGKMVGLRVVYDALNAMGQDPFQEINRRLDALSEHIRSNEDAILASSRSFNSPKSLSSEVGEI